MCKAKIDKEKVYKCPQTCKDKKKMVIFKTYGRFYLILSMLNINLCFITVVMHFIKQNYF